MADKPEMDLDLKSDCEWVRALGAEGKSIRISKADMVELIRSALPEVSKTQKGLAGSYTALEYDYRKINVSLNDLVENGYYNLDSNLVREGAPTGFVNYNIIVFRAGFSVQVLFDFKNRLLFRIYWGYWSDWMQVNFTTVQ